MCTVVPSGLVRVLCFSSLPHFPQVIVPMLMPHFSQMLSEDQIKAIVDYERGL